MDKKLIISSIVALLLGSGGAWLLTSCPECACDEAVVEMPENAPAPNLVEIGPEAPKAEKKKK